MLLENYSAGLKTQLDAWCFNSSRTVLESSIVRTVAHYNRQLDAFLAARAADPSIKPDAFTKEASLEISWTRALRNDFGRLKPLDLAHGTYVPALYRPFYKQWLYFNRRLNEMVYHPPPHLPRSGIEEQGASHDRCTRSCDFHRYHGRHNARTLRGFGCSWHAMLPLETL